MVAIRMKVTLWSAFLCECGWALYVDKARPSKVMRCTNRECEHFGRVFAIPSVELQEIPDTQFVRDGEEFEMWPPIQ